MAPTAITPQARPDMCQAAFCADSPRTFIGGRWLCGTHARPLLPSPTFIQLGRVAETEEAISAYLSAFADWPTDRDAQVALWLHLDHHFAGPATFASMKRILSMGDDPRRDLGLTLDAMSAIYAAHIGP